jgi:DNA repair exonuclease SbcCD ATPase subunit
VRNQLLDEPCIECESLRQRVAEVRDANQGFVKQNETLTLMINEKHKQLADEKLCHKETRERLNEVATDWQVMQAECRTLVRQNGEWQQMESKLAGCEKYLKEGETPAERMDRYHHDMQGLMGQLATAMKERDAALKHIKELMGEAFAHVAMDDSTFDKYVRSDVTAELAASQEAERQMSVHTVTLTKRIAELESTIKSHGIPVKTFSGGEAHYCTKEEE